MVEPITTALVITGAAAVAGTQLIKDVVTRLSARGMIVLSKTSNRNKANTQIDKLFAKVAMLRTVKTIWHGDENVDLTTFYYPTNLRKGTSSEVLQVTQLADFATTQNIVIQGTVGHGKSIFLRFLGSQELITGRVIPLFVELRHRNAKNNLQMLMLDQLKAWGLKPSVELLEELLTSGKVVLLLDAFDEIDEELWSECVREIEQLCDSYDQLKIVVTSRPESPIKQSSRFCSFHVRPLDWISVLALIDHLTSADSDVNQRIQVALRDASNTIKSIVKTPLQATLLALVFLGTNNLPNAVPEFYQGLFETLLFRHDRGKSGFKRKRKTGCTDSELQKLFQGFCFFSRLKAFGQFNHMEAAAVAQSAIEFENATCRADDFIDDIRRITCLLVEEGSSLHFLHKSVQEFFSACFVKSLTDIAASQFYASRLTLLPAWREELRYLADLDSFRFKKHAFVPACEKFLATLWKKVPSRLKRVPSLAISKFASRIEIDWVKKGEWGMRLDREAGVIGFFISDWDQNALAAIMFALNEFLRDLPDSAGAGRMNLRKVLDRYKTHESAEKARDLLAKPIFQVWECYQKAIAEVTELERKMDKIGTM